MSVKVNIVFHSMYGHIYTLAQAVKEGAESVRGTEVNLFRVKELMSDDALKKSGSAFERFSHLPVAEPSHLEDADALIFGTPTRFGMMSSQMKQFLDTTGGLWFNGSLIGKVGSVFTSTATQHGGQETTLRSFHTLLLHHGMLVAGVPYSCKELMTLDEVSGGSPYGATTLAGSDGSRQPSDNELAIAKFQGKHVADIAAKLRG